ncbi:MAG TPA: ceramidase domain-containing protein [Gemmatimonadales bacterium]|nr:ceramidase domain-containing protein [Gemmatimonadales bacterium]
MNTSMDAYCERTAPGLLAEPLNAITNASFLIAAWAAWYLARRSGRLSADIRMLLWLSAATGIGSGLWHTFATAWSLILDIIPILLFLVWFFWLYLRGVAGMSTPFVVGSIVAFLLATVLAQGFANALHGAFYYTPALIFLFVLGLYHAREREVARFSLLAAAGALGLALVFRTLDQELCPSFPIGTHFLWHSLNGLAAYLAMRGLIISRAVSVGRGVGR